MLKKNSSKKGFTLIELLVVMSIIALLLSILMPALGRARREAMLLKDSTRIKSIHTGWITWASGHNTRYPTPGYVNRQTDDVLGDVKGRGREDREKNTTDNIHSLSVMENLYAVDLLVSDNEPNPNVYVMEGYDFGARNPADDTYWHGDSPSDGPTEVDGFKADLTDGGDGCNVSYASIPLIGDRKKKEWGSSGSSEFAILSNRGPMFGQLEDHSMTYYIHGGGRTWVGNVCWQDNHMSYEESLYPVMSIYRTSEGHVPDNLFNIDCVSGLCHFWGGDTWLVLVSELTPGGDTYEYQLNPVLEWDDE